MSGGGVWAWVGAWIRGEEECVYDWRTLRGAWTRGAVGQTKLSWYKTGEAIKKLNEQTITSRR